MRSDVAALVAASGLTGKERKAKVAAVIRQMQGLEDQFAHWRAAHKQSAASAAAAASGRHGPSLLQTVAGGRQSAVMSLAQGQMRVAKQRYQRKLVRLEEKLEVTRNVLKRSERTLRSKERLKALPMMQGHIKEEQN